MVSATRPLEVETRKYREHSNDKTQEKTVGVKSGKLEEGREDIVAQKSLVNM